MEHEAWSTEQEQEAEALRAVTNAVGKLISGLLQSTEARKEKIRAMLFVALAPIFQLLAPPLSRWTIS